MLSLARCWIAPISCGDLQMPLGEVAGVVAHAVHRVHAGEGDDRQHQAECTEGASKPCGERKIADGGHAPDSRRTLSSDEAYEKFCRRNGRFLSTDRGRRGRDRRAGRRGAARAGRPRRRGARARAEPRPGGRGAAAAADRDRRAASGSACSRRSPPARRGSARSSAPPSSGRRFMDLAYAGLGEGVHGLGVHRGALFTALRGAAAAGGRGGAAGRRGRAPPATAR